MQLVVSAPGHPQCDMATFVTRPKWHCIAFVVIRQRDLKLCFDVGLCVVRGDESATDHHMLGLRYQLPTLKVCHLLSCIVKCRVV